MCHYTISMDRMGVGRYGTPTKDYSLIKILLSIIRVYLKACVFQVLKRELSNILSLIHGMVGNVINHN